MTSSGWKNWKILDWPTDIKPVSHAEEEIEERKPPKQTSRKKNPTVW